MRNKTRTLGIGLALTALLATSACVTDPETGQRKMSKAAIGGLGGALGGYLLGDIVGGRHDRTEKIVGAGLGALAPREVDSDAVHAPTLPCERAAHAALPPPWLPVS